MSSNIVVTPARLETLRSIAFGSITNSYQIVGAAFTHTISIIKVVNTCDKGMFFSFDGSTNMDYVPANGFTLYDLVSDGLVMQPGFAIYIKYEAAPTVGNVYITAIYPRGS